MGTSRVETVTLRLQNQITGPADAALGALGRLENQILREQNALGRLEGEFGRAQAAMKAMAAGAPDTKTVAAIERQTTAVAALEAQLAGSVDPADKLVGKLELARQKLAQLKSQAGPQVNVDAYRKQSTAVAQMADKVAAQKDKIGGLGAKLGDLKAKADGTKTPLGALAKFIHLVGGETGASEAKAVKMVSALLKIGLAVGAVVIAVAVATAAIAGMVGIFTKSVGAASDMREELLRLRVAGVQWWDAQRANEGPAKQLQELITATAASTAVARDKLVDYTVQLRNSYFRGNQLKTALEGMAIAGSAGGDELASKFLGLAQNARLFGGDLQKLTDRFRDKFGAVAEAKTRSLSVQILKLKENLAFAFSGADIEPLLKAMQTLLSIFNPNEQAAKSLREAITKFTEKAIGAILDLVNTALEMYIAIRTNTTGWNLMKAAGTGVVVVLLTIATAIAAVALGVAIVVGAIGLLWTGLNAVIDKLEEWWGALSAVSLYDIGSNMIDGLVAGIKAAGSKVFQALVGTVKSAVTGVKDFLGIHSKSTLMQHEIGFNMGLGVAAGNEDAAPRVEASSRSMVQAGVSGAKSSPGAASSGDGRAIEFHNCTFGGEMSESIVRKMMHAVFEAEGGEAAVPA